MRRQLPELDKGFATLLDDLASHGLLDSTIVWWGGEFGRTPKVMWEAPWNGGRGHYPKAFCTVLAGGGFRGGQAVGATDRTGEAVKDRPVYPCDLIASLYTQLGIDPAAKLPHPQGLDARAVPGPNDGVKSAGALREIM
jgi:arylsulfatase A-like enzyme